VTWPRVFLGCYDEMLRVILATEKEHPHYREAIVSAIHKEYGRHEEDIARLEPGEAGVDQAARA
jgi:hypothetical protein